MENKNLKTLLLLFLLLLSFILNIVFFNGNHSLKKERNAAVLRADSLLSEKLLLNKQIDEAKAELSRCLKAADQLGKLNPSLNDEIKAKTVLIENLKRDNATVTALRKKIKEAQKQNEDYLSQMNSLLQKIQELENKITQFNKQIADLTSENNELKKELELAKEIKARNISALGYKVANSKSKLTFKTKKVNRISVTAELMENPLAGLGNKKVALLVYSEGKILSDGKNKFMEKKTNTELSCSALKDITYSGTDQKVTVNYDFDQKLLKGKYKVELYVDGSLAGKTEFMLR